MNLHLVFMVLAAIVFLLKALNVNLASLDLQALGFFFVVMAFIL